MPAKGGISLVECEIQILSGNTFTLTVQLDWTVATLKERIEYEMSVPSYSQVLSDTNRKLPNKESLRDVHLAQGSLGTCLCLFLRCLEIPSQLGTAEVQCAWEAFRMHSTDYGDTISQIHVSGVMRYVQMRASYESAKHLLVDRELMSFADVLAVLASWKDVVMKREPEGFLERVLDDCYFFEVEDACRPAVAPTKTAWLYASNRKKRKESRRRAKGCCASTYEPMNGDGSAASFSFRQSIASTDGVGAPALMSL
eukprot:TRINITY_DN4148_c0_g2_i1.p1 TRINITY_DN4148_c0_g2~~TRINITY_DN4148_c0_g2_i1.p1  ORF type:complete len:273 (+),score=24.01 TRINITY_DN4148_c0_g2_i1:55-819(+)